MEWNTRWLEKMEKSEMEINARWDLLVEAKREWNENNLMLWEESISSKWYRLIQRLSATCYTLTGSLNCRCVSASVLFLLRNELLRPQSAIEPAMGTQRRVPSGGATRCLPFSAIQPTWLSFSPAISFQFQHQPMTSHCELKLNKWWTLWHLNNI